MVNKVSYMFPSSVMMTENGVVLQTIIPQPILPIKAGSI